MAEQIEITGRPRPPRRLDNTSTSEASGYQQLRDHLNYLRLADASP